MAVLIQPAEDHNVVTSKEVVKDWPLADLDQAKRWQATKKQRIRCMVVPAKKSKPVARTKKEADGMVLWRSAGEKYWVWLHPMLPHENGGCASVQPYFPTSSS